MRAYKFRSSTNIEFALDILLNRRLFCSDWRELNDPMEGMFVYSTHGRESHAQRVVKGIGSAKSRYKVCSLSRDFQSHLLWAHYANGFDGLAIEVDLPDDNQDIRQVEYRGVFAFLDMDQVVDEDDAARRILYSKYNEWSYEEEVRILSSENYYQLERPIRRVIAGPRMNQALFQTIHMVCDKEGIEFTKVGIGDDGIDADFVPPADLQRRRRRVRSSL
jgi:hypothetical protein